MMQQSRKALYNSLRAYWKESPTLSVEDWQVLDYRKLMIEEIFSTLHQLKIVIDEEYFMTLSDHLDSPEEIAEHLVINPEDEALCDRVYLLVFELWRRKVSDKKPVTVFCDTLDFVIDLYDEKPTEKTKNKVANQLLNLKELLDINVDHGQEEQKVFQFVSMQSSHDLEAFLFDFIADLIDEGNLSFAVELVDDFISYISDSSWFVILKLQIEKEKDKEVFKDHLYEFCDSVDSQEDFLLNLEIISLLGIIGDWGRLYRFTNLALKLVRYEKDLLEMLFTLEEVLQPISDNEIKDLILFRQNLKIDENSSLEPNDSVLSKVESIVARYVQISV